jgi:catechol 2,3-dioxygenase-like lactoylglutathione lyase family enzyme
MTRVHVSLHVRDLDAAVRFYRAFFGAEPAVHARDYAKFEIQEPPLVLALEPVFHRASDAFDHLGLRVDGPDGVRAAHARLRDAGLLGAGAACEDDVACCYSRQTKFWLADPDENLWEVYALTGALDRRGALSASEALAARDRTRIASAFEHRLGTPLPPRFPGDAASVDEVRFRGTFNAGAFDAREAAGALAEAMRVLRPGGALLVHALVADRPLPGEFPLLPGPAALVRHAPAARAIPAAILDAGFANAVLHKLGEAPAFRHAGVALRELLVTAEKPTRPLQSKSVVVLAGAHRTVVYKGPFRTVTCDAGHTFARGVPVAVDAAVFADITAGPLRDFFHVLEPDAMKEAACEPSS